jgi:putative hydrolase of the HAD superfamily
MVHVNDLRAITLDLDDTLWEIHPVIHRAERELYAWLGEQYPRLTEQFSREDLQTQRAAIADEFPRQSHDYTFLRRTVLGRLGAAAGYGERLVDEAMAVFDALRNDVELFPEVRPALAALRERYVLVAVTNGNANLEMIGIDHLFHGIVTARTAGAAKPAREIFAAAVTAAGCKPEQTLHVGDHPEFDVAGAISAGLHAVWVNRHGAAWPDDLQEPHAEVAHVGQLPELLEQAAR